MPRRSSADRAARFRSSREAYHWILWDAGFSPSEFVIVYDDHDDVPGEVALEGFEPDGEIPWHRVWAIRRGDETVWDRELRIDRLAEVRRAPGVPPPARSRTRIKSPRSRASFLCPQCAELVDTSPDAGGGARQTYLEDCPVCCRPNRIDAAWSDAEGGYVVQATAED